MYGEVRWPKTRHDQRHADRVEEVQRRGHPTAHAVVALEEQRGRTVVEEAEKGEPRELTPARGEAHPAQQHQHRHQCRG